MSFCPTDDLRTKRVPIARTKKGPKPRGSKHSHLAEGIETATQRIEFTATNNDVIHEFDSVYAGRLAELPSHADIGG